MTSTCIYRELHPPTGVTHVVSGYFTHTPLCEGGSRPNLIVARTTEVDVYRIRFGGQGRARHASTFGSST